MTTIAVEHRPQPTQEVAKKANHRANLIRVGDILPHNNADTLELILIEGYQVVVKKGEFKTGDLAVYLCPDSVVPQTEPFKFIWFPHVESWVGTGIELPEVSERHRRITVRKFRGEWSEGLLLPARDFQQIRDGWLVDGDPALGEGDDLSDLLGVTHYDPDKGKESTEAGKTMVGPKYKAKRPKTLKGWFYYLLHLL